MRSFQKATALGSPIVGRVERLLLAEGEEELEPRRQDVLHVSELSRSDFCPRGAFYRISGAPLLAPAQATSARLQAIFEEGHDVHAKWQRWMRRLGDLYGRWRCLVCGHTWFGTSPTECGSNDNPWVDACPAKPWQIQYMEVPVDREDDYLLIGHGDGQIGGPKGPWVEIKTIGQGTVRMDAPSLFKKHTRKVIEVDQREDPAAKVFSYLDLDQVWRDLRSPFAAHLRQGNIYCALAGVEECIFLYEFKPTQARKDFVIRASPGVYEPLLEKALDVRYALRKDRPPRCPHGGCALCKAYEEERHDRAPKGSKATAARSTRSDTGTRRRAVRPSGRDALEPGRRRLAVAEEATVRAPRDAGRRDRVGQPRTDGAVRPVHGLGGLLGRASGDR